MKELELVRSGLLVDMPHKVIDYRIVDVLEALKKRLTALEENKADRRRHSAIRRPPMPDPDKSEGLKRQIRREELAMRIANGTDSDEVLEVVKAVVGGAKISDGRWRSLPYGESPYPRWQEWTISTKPPVEQASLPRFEDMKGIYADKPCSTCGGKRQVYSDSKFDEFGVASIVRCPTCKGSGKEA